MWQNKLLSHVSLFSCHQTDAERAVSILVVDERVILSEQRRRHSASEIDEAKRAWPILTEGIAFTPLSNKFFSAGSLSGADKVVEEWFEPRGASQQDAWLDIYEALLTQKGEDPMVRIGCIDGVANMLSCLDIHKTEAVLRCQIIR